MNKIYFALLLFIVGCASSKSVIYEPITSNYASVTEVSDTLNLFCDDKYDSVQLCGYLNQQGDTLISKYEFQILFSETFLNFAFVYDAQKFGKEIVAINRDKKVVFEAFMYDNGPDYLSEGLFRIKQNGKIGFANEKGEIIIPAIYECAYPFEEGIAKVSMRCETVTDGFEHFGWESKEWFFINQKGQKVSGN